MSDHDAKVAEIEAAVSAYFAQAPPTQPPRGFGKMTVDDWHNLRQPSVVLPWSFGGGQPNSPSGGLSAYGGIAQVPGPMTATEVSERQRAGMAQANAMAAQQDAYLQQLVAEMMQLVINPPVIGVDPGAPGGDKTAIVGRKTTI